MLLDYFRPILRKEIFDFRPILLNEIEECVTKMHKDSNLLFSAEYEVNYIQKKTWFIVLMQGTKKIEYVFFSECIYVFCQSKF